MEQPNLPKVDLEIGEEWQPNFPKIDFEIDEEWQWPAWQYGFRQEDMFGALWLEFNTVAQPVLSHDAWRYDLQDAASRAGGSTAEFRRLLEKQRKIRLQEFRFIRERVMSAITMQPDSVPSEDFWSAALAYSRNRSIDTILQLLDTSVDRSDHAKINAHEQHESKSIQASRKVRSGSSRPRKTPESFRKSRGVVKRSAKKKNPIRTGTERYNLRPLQTQRQNER